MESYTATIENIVQSYKVKAKTETKLDQLHNPSNKYVYGSVATSKREIQQSKHLNSLLTTQDSIQQIQNFNTEIDENITHKVGINAVKYIRVSTTTLILLK